MSEPTDEDPTITPDYIEIPRFGGRRERLDLPTGSKELVQQYLESETLETQMDAAIATMSRAKQKIAEQRKMFMYEIMGRANAEAISKEKERSQIDKKKPKETIVKESDKFDGEKPPKKKKPPKK